ncbi:DUF397 domain-containing protein [Streptomyces eurocidicus]|uniref:DUF397 domain-containing protein n=1 Tax=Streptomyces eurocidicus TaxID=66423 RepID=UPI000C9A6134|nr:DUF397 domain-containing protein [Streptomyces eurocidicus]
MSTPPDLTRAIWAKSSYSGGTGGQCVEWAPGYASSGVIPVRDSKTPHGPALAFPASAWDSFIAGVKDGGFTAA